MIELIMSYRQNASMFKVGGTTSVNGDNVITGAIKSRDYDGTDGDSDNTHGSVINLDGKGRNFGGKFIYDQEKDKLSIKGDIEAESFRCETVEYTVSFSESGIDIFNKKATSDGRIAVYGSDYYTALHEKSLVFGIQGKSDSHHGHIDYGTDEVFNFDKPIKFNVPQNGRQAQPVGSWTNASTGNAIAVIGVDSKGNLLVYGNFNGDGETYETRYVATSKTKPL